MTPRTCLDCPAQISRQSKGRCRSCGMRAVTQRPGHATRISAGMRRAWADPEKRANMRPGENIRAWLAKPDTPDRLREIGRRLNARNRAEAAERERLATLTPFERTLERVRSGARVVTKPRIPSPVHSFTLGGVSAGML